MYEFASSSATLLIYTAVMHTRRMNVIPEAELWNYDTFLSANPSHRSLLFFFRTDFTDYPDCLPILLSIPGFTV